MTKQYKALKPVGHWLKGDIIGHLPETQINQLITDGVIKEYQPLVEEKIEDKPAVKAKGVEK